MRDEYDQPNRRMRDVLGVEQTALDAPEDAQVGYIKQDLPWVRALDTVSWNDGDTAADTAADSTVVGVRGRVSPTDATVVGRFQNGAFSDGRRLGVLPPPRRPPPGRFRPASGGHR